jgi:glucose dehydrogenase
VSLLRRPRYRFVLWAVILIAVAAVTGIVGLDWWLIVVIVFGVWIVLTIIERRLDRAPERPVATAPAPVVAPPPLSEPDAPRAEVPLTRRRRLLSPRQPVAVTASAPVADGEKQWSIWTLDRVARETSDAELRFLVLSLQEYADSDGMLPLQFDPLVRESFGELLGSTG